MKRIAIIAAAAIAVIAATITTVCVIRKRG